MAGSKEEVDSSCKMEVKIYLISATYPGADCFESNDDIHD